MGGRKTKDKNVEIEDKNKEEEVKTKGAHRGKFCQGVLGENMITQQQNPRSLECSRNPRILIHPWKGRGLVLKTTRHATKERKEIFSLRK